MTPDLQLHIQLNAIQFRGFFKLWTLSDTSEHHEGPEGNSNRICPQSRLQATDFRTENPDLLFLHVEAAFRNAQIKQSKTKFDHILQKLPQKIMVSVGSLIMGSAASSATPYADLKAKLVSSYTLSWWQMVSKLIHHPGLGDRLPTALMDTMLALLQEDETPGSLFLGLFKERLPVEMRDYLVFRESKNPSEMALYADSLWEARKAIPTDHFLAASSTS